MLRPVRCRPPSAAPPGQSDPAVFVFPSAVHNLPFLSLKQLYGLAYQWVAVQEDPEIDQRAKVVTDFLEFVGKAKPKATSKQSRPKN